MLFLRCSFFKVPLLSEALFQGALLSDSFAIILLTSACVNNFFNFFIANFCFFIGGKEQETADARSISISRRFGRGKNAKIALARTENPHFFAGDQLDLITIKKSGRSSPRPEIKFRSDIDRAPRQLITVFSVSLSKMWTLFGSIAKRITSPT